MGQTRCVGQQVLDADRFPVGCRTWQVFLHRIVETYTAVLYEQHDPRGGELLRQRIQKKIVSGRADS